MSKANEIQRGGNHYKSVEDKGLPQHWDIAIAMDWSYCLGAATKYLWRLGKKGGPEKAIEDLEKSIHYLQKELEVRKNKLEAEQAEQAEEEFILGVERAMQWKPTHK